MLFSFGETAYNTNDWCDFCVTTVDRPDGSDDLCFSLGQSAFTYMRKDSDVGKALVAWRDAGIHVFQTKPVSLSIGPV